MPGGNLERTQLYADAGSDRYVAEAKQLRDVQVYLWFARFPVYQVSHDGDGHTRVDISDVRFFRDLSRRTKADAASRRDANPRRRIHV